MQLFWTQRKHRIFQGANRQCNAKKKWYKIKALSEQKGWHHISLNEFTIAYKLNETMSRNRGKLEQDEKLFYPFLCNFWLLVPIFYFGRVLGFASTHFWVSPIISKFPKILGLKLFGNLWDNSYTVFFVLDFMYHFTCEESSHTKIFKIYWKKILRKNKCWNNQLRKAVW